MNVNTSLIFMWQNMLCDFVLSYAFLATMLHAWELLKWCFIFPRCDEFSFLLCDPLPCITWYCLQQIRRNEKFSYIFSHFFSSFNIFWGLLILSTCSMNICLSPSIFGCFVEKISATVDFFEIKNLRILWVACHISYLNWLFCRRLRERKKQKRIYGFFKMNCINFQHFYIRCVTFCWHSKNFRFEKLSKHMQNKMKFKGNEIIKKYTCMMEI